MAESSTSYIRLVQHLIEECILFKMSKEECEAALSKHANINRLITSTVWKELEKENKGFFEEYHAKMGDSSTPPNDHKADDVAEEIQIPEEEDRLIGSP